MKIQGRVYGKTEAMLDEILDRYVSGLLPARVLFVSRTDSVARRTARRLADMGRERRINTTLCSDGVSVEFGTLITVEFTTQGEVIDGRGLSFQ